MLQRKPGPPPKLRTYGFLVGIELDLDDTSPDQVALKLGDACTFMEGAGAAQVECLGEIADYDDEPEGTSGLGDA